MTNETKATIAYEEQRARLERAMERMRELLAAHHDAQQRAPRNGGYVGDLGNVAQTIETDVIQFLGGGK